MANLSTRPRPHLHAAVVLGVYFVLAVTTIAWSTQAANVAEAWFANAWLLASVLRGTLRSPVLALAGGAVMVALANIVMALPWTAACGYAVANMVEVGVALCLVRWLGLSLENGLDGREFVLGLLATVVVAPAASALVGASVVRAVFGSNWLPVFRGWWVGDAVGTLIMLPPLLACSASRLRYLLWGRRAPAFWLALCGSFIVTALSATYLQRPFVVWTIPLLFAAYQLGVFGTMLVSCANAALVLVLAAGEANGWGPYTVGLYGLSELELVSFSASAVIGPMIISLVLNQRRQETRRVADLSNRLRVVADNVPALIGQLDTRRRYVFVNRKYLDWYDKSNDEVIGRTPADVFGAEMGRRLDPHIDRVLQGESFLFSTVMPNGRHVEAHYAPLTQHGQVEGFFVMAQDVTARFELEAQVKDIADNVPALIAYLDDHLTYQFANQRYLELWGAGEVRVVGAFVGDVIGEVMFEELHPKMLRCLHGERVSWELQHPGGAVFDMTYVPRIIAGKVTGIYKLGVDVTARKQAEALLFEARDCAERMLDAIGDAVVACDASMRVTMINPVAEKMTGWSEAEALGRAFDDVVQLVDMESGGRPLNPLAIAMRDDRIVALQANSALRHRDGMQAAIEDSASPIHDARGEVTGAIMVFHDVSEARAMAMKMSHLAQHDYLTDLPNRILLEDRLSRVLAVSGQDDGGLGALLFVDLDHFKHINDSLGHPAGDVVLREIASRLRAVVRAQDTVSRQGGDEFVVLIHSIGQPGDASRIAEKIIRAAEQPVEFEGQELRVSASVGIALFPSDSGDSATLMKQADMALYHAKQSGRGRFSYFSEQMSEKANLRLELEQALRIAIQRKQLHLEYQPKVHWPTQSLIGIEALARWTREDGTVVAPAHFVELAEEAGFVGDLDAWGLDATCRQMAAWRRDDVPLVPVSMNVSLVGLDAEKLLRSVRRALDMYQLPSQYLELEFTETQMFSHGGQAEDLLAELRALGIRVIVDDFGTGYSNLVHVSQYAFDTLKIDRSFVQGVPHDEKQHAVVQAVIAMGKAMGHSLLAEGVETEAQARMLVAHGCLDMQGFLFSPSVSAARCASFLRDPRQLFASLEHS